MIPSAARLSRIPKKAAGHAPLSASWVRWSRLVMGEAVAWMRHPATAIARYSVDHTGPNAEAGGAQGGLLSRS